MEYVANTSGWRQSIENFIGHTKVQHTLVVLIVVNALILGLETSQNIMAVAGYELHLIDQIILWIFIGELALLMTARGFRFFLRLVNKIDSMRKVVIGLLHSLPSLSSVFGLIMVIFYVFAVIATNMFGSKFPDLFGDLGTTMFTLFQVMTLESWSEGVARPVMEIFPHAWLFFVIFIFIATFVIINLFIAVIVDSLNSSKQAGQPKPEELVLAELRILRDELAELRHQVAGRK
ncbi:MAG: ion transporter [Oxalobacteraceae bacterium]|nr:ion transporter [Oxalobacteraceae bacterium]